MFVASLLTIPSILIEIGSASDEMQAFAMVLNVAIWLAFLFEFLVMMRVVPDRGEWMTSHKLEVFLLFAAFPVAPTGFGLLRVLRVLRVSRLARIAKIGRASFGMKGLAYATLVAALFVLAAGSLFAEVEQGRNYSQWDGVWWAITTMSTVGYGDFSPQTTGGRIIAMFVMALGISFFAVLTAAFAEWFIKHDTDAQATGRSDDAHDRRHGEIMEQLRSISDRIGVLESSMLEPEAVTTSDEERTQL